MQADRQCGQEFATQLSGCVSVFVFSLHPVIGNGVVALEDEI